MKDLLDVAVATRVRQLEVYRERLQNFTVIKKLLIDPNIITSLDVDDVIDETRKAIRGLESLTIYPGAKV